MRTPGFCLLFSALFSLNQASAGEPHPLPEPSTAPILLAPQISDQDLLFQSAQLGSSLLAHGVNDFLVPHVSQCSGGGDVFKSVPPVPKPVKVYKCEYAPTVDSKEPKGVLQISFYEDNDNLFMGLWSLIPKAHDGNDLGYTHGERTSIKFIRGKNEFGFDATSGEYSAAITDQSGQGGGKIASQNFHDVVTTNSGTQTYDNNYDWSNGGVKAGSAMVRTSPDGKTEKQSERFVDLTRMMASWKHGDEFYV